MELSFEIFLFSAYNDIRVKRSKSDASNLGTKLLKKWKKEEKV